MSRQSELLRAAADGLDDGEHPFCDKFLGEHDVTLDECFEMAALMAAGARVVAWAIENPPPGGKCSFCGSAGTAMKVITEALGKVTLTSEREGQ